LKRTCGVTWAPALQVRTLVEAPPIRLGWAATAAVAEPTATSTADEIRNVVTGMWIVVPVVVNCWPKAASRSIYRTATSGAY
jgi:hypothetical protein